MAHTRRGGHRFESCSRYKASPWILIRGFFFDLIPAQMDQPLDYVVYVLWSERHRKRYVGMTSNLIGRFRSHNSLGKKGWTVKFRPWHVVHVEFYMSKGSARARENFLKTGKGREWMALN